METVTQFSEKEIYIKEIPTMAYFVVEQENERRAIKRSYIGSPNNGWHLF